MCLLTNFKKYKINLTCANSSEMEFKGFGKYKGSFNGYNITLNKVFYSKMKIKIWLVEFNLPIWN